MLGDLRFAPCAVGGRPGWGSAYGTAATAISTNVRSYRRVSLRDDRRPDLSQRALS